MKTAKQCPSDGGDSDCCDCLDCCIDNQVQALAAAVKARCCNQTAKGKSAKSFDPAALAKLLQDVIAAVPAVAPVIQDLLNLFK